MDERKPDICLFHANCSDGFTAAWAIQQRWKGIECVPVQYGQAPPLVAGKHVLIVDFSYDAATLEMLARVAKSITVLDHHKTAQAALAIYQVPVADGREPVFKGAEMLSKQEVTIQAHFDMDKSGAALAWEYAWPRTPYPRLVENVQDRDLWRFTMDDTRAVSAVLMSHEMTFETWTKLARQVESPGTRAGIIAEGESILRDRDRLMQGMIEASARWMTIGGHQVPVANLPYAFASDAAGQMAAGHPFAAAYFDREDGLRQFSLRRRDGEVDVSAIAKGYGGGGQAAAAGFTAPKGWEGEAELLVDAPAKWPVDTVTLAPPAAKIEVEA